MDIAVRCVVLFAVLSVSGGLARGADLMRDVFHPCEMRGEAAIEADLKAQGNALRGANALSRDTRQAYVALQSDRKKAEGTPGDLDLALRQAYFNTILAGADLAIQKYGSDVAQQAATECKKVMLADYGNHRPTTDSAQLAKLTSAAIDRARLLSSELALAQQVSDEAESQFIELRITMIEGRSEDAKKLAALVPAYPMKAVVEAPKSPEAATSASEVAAKAKAEMERGEALKAIASASDVATKAEALAKDAQSQADAAAARVLAVDKNGKPKIAPDAPRRASDADRAHKIAQDADIAQRLAKEARDASDFAIAQGLRAESKGDRSLYAQDMATANASTAQLNALSARIDHYRSDALLARLGLDAASDEQKLSVAQQREYVTFLSVLDENPDAQALLGAPGVTLKADSGDTDATLKLSMDRVVGLQTRLVDLTLTAPVTKNRTSYVDTVDGLAKGFTAKLTGTSYWLMPPTSKPTFFGILGAGARVGHENHTYVDVDDLSKTVDVSRTPSSAFAFAGLAPVTMKWLLLGKFEFQRAYTDADDGTRCPGAASGVVTCQTGPIGAPTLAHKRIWSFEARKAWDKYAIGALVSRDLAARQTKVDVPIYLLTGTDDKGGSPLTGGIDLGWDTKNHATFGIFVGTSFSVADY
jgi:hypothetical protein